MAEPGDDHDFSTEDIETLREMLDPEENKVKSQMSFGAMACFCAPALALTYHLTWPRADALWAVGVGILVLFYLLLGVRFIALRWRAIEYEKVGAILKSDRGTEFLKLGTTD